MKKLLYILVTFHFLLLTLHAQTPTWTKILGGPRDDFGNSAFQTMDGYFLLVGERRVQYINNPNFYVSQSYLAKFSLTGNMIWQKYYGDSLIANYALTAVEDPQGNLYVPYIANSERNLMKVNGNGDILWQRSYPDNVISLFSTIKFSTDSNYLIIGGYTEVPSHNYDWTVTLNKLDTSGNLLWSKSYYDSMETYSAGFGNPLVTQDAYYITGRKGQSLSTFRGILIKVDTSGNVVWNKTFYNGVIILYSVAQNSENIFIALGTICQGNNCEAYLVKFNGNGDTIWQRSYPDSTKIGGWRIVKTLDNNFIIPTSALPENAQITKIDSNGNVIFTKTHYYYDPESFVVYYNLNISSDSGFIIAGKFNLNSNYYSDILLVKTDKFGNTTPIGIKPINNEVPESFKLFQNFPNPFNSSTAIKFDIGKFVNNARLIIYDILGRQITTLIDQSLKPGSYEIKWNAASLSSGVYFVMLAANGFRYIRKMLYLK